MARSGQCINPLLMVCAVVPHAGDESAIMLDAHTEAGFLVGLPFAGDGVYDFATHGDKTRQVARLGAIMLQVPSSWPCCHVFEHPHDLLPYLTYSASTQHRLTAPPEEAYSLHRKLSGAFLACIKLRAKVPCRQLFLQAYDQYKTQHGDTPTPTVSGSTAAQH